MEISVFPLTFLYHGMLRNIAVLDGYRPFLTAVHMLNKMGQPFFPDTMGAGIGVERTLYAMLKGANIERSTTSPASERTLTPTPYSSSKDIIRFP